MKTLNYLASLLCVVAAFSCCQRPSSAGEDPSKTDSTTIIVPVDTSSVTPSPKVGAPEGFGPLPTAAQVQWQRMETNMFVHFGPNTFTNVEWGYGTDEELAAFAPKTVDCEQWVGVAAECGFKGIILTAKHHDGFCLWPNKHSTHTIAYTSYKDGKGDIVKELSQACAAAGVKFGIYDSPWDRHDSAYGTGNKYNQIFKNTIEDLHSNYGELFEQWFDGAKGEDGKTQDYDFDLFNSTVLSLHPDCVIFSNVGPGCRWAGQEWGDAWPTCWSTFSPDYHDASQSSLPGDYESYLGQGDNPTVSGARWIPIECDTSIRTKDTQDNGNPMWFWNSLGNEYTRSAKNLMQLYYSSVGRNGLLLLNVPPTTDGVFDEKDVASLRGFKQMRDKVFGTNLAEEASVSADAVRGEGFEASRVLDGNYDSYYAAPDGSKTAILEFTFPQERTFNRVLIQEYIPLGQRVRSFSLQYKEAGSDKWKALKWKVNGHSTAVDGTTIGHKRILLTDLTTAVAIRLKIDSAYACPVLNGFGVYLDDVTGLENDDLDYHDR